MPQKNFQIFKGEEDGTGKGKGRETPAVGLGEPFTLRETKDWCNSIKDPSALGSAHGRSSSSLLLRTQIICSLGWWMMLVFSCGLQENQTENPRKRDLSHAIHHFLCGRAWGFLLTKCCFFKSLFPNLSMEIQC